MEYVQISFKVILAFLIMLSFFRVAGNKDLGEINLLDIGMNLIVIELIVGLIEHATPILKSLYPIGILIFIQLCLNYLGMKNQTIRSIFQGKPIIIIEKGKCNQKNMKKTGYNLNDLFTQLRIKDISDISNVDYAILETSGELTIFEKNKKFILPIIQDGVLQERNLMILDKDKKWLLDELQKLKVKVEDIFICSYDKEDFYFELKK